MKVDQLGLIQDYKFLNYLESKYIKTYKIVTNEFESGRKLVTYKGVIVPFYIFESKCNIKLVGSDGNLKYRVRVELEGDIEQYVFEKELFDSKTIKDISKVIEDSTRFELEDATKYFQNTIGHDYLRFGEKTKQDNYKVFQKYEENWDETFRKADITYDVKVNIRRIGTSKK
jgi:hypothetical protein